ncbi:MBL fold metallo-hydrolase, partial [Streptomyces sp. SID3212]|nr:MBL fold metallo-hydrolase [Streptomyces sp. SID3212]
MYGADLRRGPVAGLGERYARVTVEAVVTSDPRPTRPRVFGDRMAGGAFLLEAEVTRVTGPDGAVTAVRTPVLVLATPGANAGRWQRVLPSTRLRLTGRLSPPLYGDDR